MNIDISQLIVVIFLTLNIFSFILGYFLGKLSKINLSQSNDIVPTKDRNIDNKKEIISKINIDETKIVTKIDTNNLEKKYDTLGNTILTNSDIGSSINKLKKMKE